MELTREEVEAFALCDYVASCRNCKAWYKCPERGNHVFSLLGKELLAEMEKPKVWDGAPSGAGFAAVSYKENEREGNLTWLSDCRTYTREPPKTRARVIAEETYVDLEDFTHEDFIIALESAINRALAEVKK